MEIEKAYKRLLISNPFYGLFCMSLPKVVTTKIDTLQVTKNGISCQLNINPNFWEQHTDDEQIALLQHELGHIALQHMFLMDSFSNKAIFNVSADVEVNSYIENLPKSAITNDYLTKNLGVYVDKGLGTKAYYDMIMNYQNQKKQPSPSPQQEDESESNNEKCPNSSSSPSSAPQNEEPDNDEGEEKREQEKENKYPKEFKDRVPIDNHDSWEEFKNIPEATKQLMQNNINNILKDTTDQIEKSGGTVPGELRGIIEKLREKKPQVFNWKAYFRRMLGSIYDVNIKSTRRKESKRFSGAAGIQHKKKVSILVAVDTSGSVSVKELQEFFSEIDFVYKAGARVTILECDAHINSITEYDGKNIPEIKGRGGTDLNPPVDYYKKHLKEYASLIYFTDGEAPIPNNPPSNIVWVISSMGLHQDYPGKTIYIPKQQKT